MLLHRLRSTIVCNSDRNGRILKSDQSGRNLRVLLFRRPLGAARQVTILSQLKVGESAVLVALNLPESVQNHLMHMGFVPGSLVTVLRRAPAGDPTVYLIDGMEIALRHETADAIIVRPCGQPSAKQTSLDLEVQDLEVQDLEVQDIEDPSIEEASVPQLLLEASR